MIRVLLVDDHRVVTSALRSYLESFEDFQVVGWVTSGEAALAFINDQAPDVVVMDLLMPGGIDGVETTRRIGRRARTVVLTASMDDTRMIACLRSGAAGYVRKDSDPGALLNAIRAAARDEITVDGKAAGAALTRSPDNLTAREREVLLEVARGRTNREIAAELNIAEETVKTHVASILSKLRLAHRAQAIGYALKQGLLSVEDL